MKNKLFILFLISLTIYFVFSYRWAAEKEKEYNNELEKTKRELQKSFKEIDSLQKEFNKVNEKYDSLLTVKRKVYVQKINNYRFAGVDSNIIVLSGFLSKEINFE